MAKANKNIDPARREAVKLKLPVNPPSNDWVNNEMPNRVIDLADNQDDIESQVDGNVTLGESKDLSINGKDKIERNKNAGQDANVVRPKGAQKARDLTKNEINGLYGEMIEHGRRTVEKAIAIGGKLIQVKATLKHGQFGFWIDTSLHFDQKTAKRYMKLASGREKLKIDNMSNITNALRVLDEDSRVRNAKSIEIANPVEAKAAAQQAMPRIVHIAKDEEVKATVAGKFEVVAVAPDIVNAPRLPLFVASVPEEALGELLEVMKRHEGKCQHQVIRGGGDVKLNQYFINRLRLTA